MNAYQWKATSVAGLAIVALFAGSQAFGLTFSASSGSLAAQADFEIVGGNLQVTLANVSAADVLVPVDVLTAVFFSLPGSISLTPVSAVLGSGSSVLFGGTDPGNVVGGEWELGSGLTNAPGGATMALSSAGFGLAGSSLVRFPGTDLQPPPNVDGLQYGITSAGDNPATGNTPVTGTNALIQNSVVFTLSGISADFMLDSITNVSFQYGTAFCDPNLPSVPEPATVALFGIGLGSLVVTRMRRKI